MSALTDEELAHIVRSLGGPELIASSKSETARMVAELGALRTARDAKRVAQRRLLESADTDRMRSVVREAILLYGVVQHLPAPDLRAADERKDRRDQDDCHDLWDGAVRMLRDP